MECVWSVCGFFRHSLLQCVYPLASRSCKLRRPMTEVLHRWMTYCLCRLCHGDTSCKPPRSNMRPDWLLRLEVSRVTRVLEGSNQGNREREKKKGPVIKSLAGNVSQICHAATHFSSPSAFILKRLIKGVKRRLGGTDTQFFFVSVFAGRSRPNSCPLSLPPPLPRPACPLPCKCQCLHVCELIILKFTMYCSNRPHKNCTWLGKPSDISAACSPG